MMDEKTVFEHSLHDRGSRENAYLLGPVGQGLTHLKVSWEHHSSGNSCETLGP